MTADLRVVPDEPLACPRCGERPVGVYYGPCAACVDDLKAKFGREAREVDVAEYEPKMNVTPNAVALKD